MLVEDQLGVGDFVDMEKASGTVVAIGLRVTQLRDDDGTVWYVRNGEVDPGRKLQPGRSRAPAGSGSGRLVSCVASRPALLASEGLRRLRAGLRQLRASGFDGLRREGASLVERGFHGDRGAGQARGNRAAGLGFLGRFLELLRGDPGDTAREGELDPGDSRTRLERHVGRGCRCWSAGCRLWSGRVGERHREAG